MERERDGDPRERTHANNSKKSSFVFRPGGTFYVRKRESQYYLQGKRQHCSATREAAGGF